MKTTIFSFIAALTSLSGGLFAQRTSVGFTKGMVFHFTRQDAPDILTYYPDYWRIKKPKEQKEFEEAFEVGVSQGKYEGKNFNFDMTISDVLSGDNGTIYEFNYTQDGYSSNTYYSCINDTLYVTRSLNGYPLVSEGDTVGFMMLGLVRYPLSMKVGDVLPATTDLTFTFPKKMDLSYQKQILEQVFSHTQTKTYQGYRDSQTNYYYQLRTITKDLSYTLQFSAPTVTYRHVVGEENVVVGGKTYKAYRIETVFETRLNDMISNVDADVLLDKWALEFLNNYIVKKANKGQMKVSGYEVFVPELGLCSSAEVFDAKGKSQYKMLLNGFN